MVSTYIKCSSGSHLSHSEFWCKAHLLAEVFLCCYRLLLFLRLALLCFYLLWHANNNTASQYLESPFMGDIWLISPHLDVCSSLAPALADLGCICPGLLQFVASLPCKDWSLIIGESLYGHDFIKIPNLRDFDNWWGLLEAVLSRGRSHPWVHYELPLGLVARVELRFMGVVERLVGKSARLFIKILKILSHPQVLTSVMAFEQFLNSV